MDILLIIVVILISLRVILCFFPIRKKRNVSLDRIYYINLDRRPDRNKHFLKQCEKENIDMSIVQRFSAVDGKTWKFTKQEMKMFENADFKHEPHKYTVMGNQLSHYYILKEMLKKNYNLILIMQDDVVFKKNFQSHLQHVLHSIPEDAEIVNIGFHKHAVYRDFIPINVDNDKENILHCNSRSYSNDYVCDVQDEKAVACSLAYLVTRKGAINLTHHFETHGFLRATDWNYHDYLAPKNIHYGSRIALCTGAPLGSDVFPNESS